jgi:phage-related protein
MFTGTPSATGTPPPTDDGSDGIDDIINQAGNFFTWVVNSFTGFTAWIGSAVSWIGGTINNVGIGISNLISQIGSLLDLIFGFLGDMLTILGLIARSIISLFELFGAWIGQLIETAQSIITAWFTTPATPIPGLPQCVSAPMDSGICAVWFVMSYTILSGTIGGLLIPAMLILLNLSMVLYFVRFARNLVLKAQQGQK